MLSCLARDKPRDGVIILTDGATHPSILSFAIVGHGKAVSEVRVSLNDCWTGWLKEASQRVVVSRIPSEHGAPPS